MGTVRGTVTPRKDTSLLNSTWFQILDFILTVVYPPKLWRFMSLLFEKYQLTKKVMRGMVI